MAAGLRGITSLDEMYIDNFVIWDGCLSCGPPNPASNLTAVEIYNPDSAVKLDWQNNSPIWVYGFYIVRKIGYPNDPGNFEYIGGTESGTTEYIDSLVAVNDRYSYGVITYGRYGFADTSNFATILVEPTPVELTSFTYSINSFNDVNLNWTTATETNSKGFEVQRSEVRDQKSELKEIGFVDGNGTTTEEHSYSFVDKNISDGKYYYRLKQIDFDGSYEYSREVEVNVTAPDKFSLEQNYPNPFNPITNIEYRIPNKVFVSLKVYNTLGEEVATSVNEEKPAGNYEVKFDGSKLPSGVYIYRLTAGSVGRRGESFSKSRKFILLK